MHDVQKHRRDESKRDCKHLGKSWNSSALPSVTIPMARQRLSVYSRQITIGPASVMR